MGALGHSWGVGVGFVVDFLLKCISSIGGGGHLGPGGKSGWGGYLGHVLAAIDQKAGLAAMRSSTKGARGPPREHALGFRRLVGKE
jgi:hypothetical protein